MMISLFTNYTLPFDWNYKISSNIDRSQVYMQ
jgi:hypothetical protein